MSEFSFPFSFVVCICLCLGVSCFWREGREWGDDIGVAVGKLEGLCGDKC